MKSRPTHRAYFISGLACGAVAFERIKTPEHVENVFLEWQIPNKNEPIQDYAKRFVKQIKTDLPFYLIGLSFGGIMVQEVAQYISPKKIILISSVKSRKELPKRIKLGKYLPLHRLLMGKRSMNTSILFYKLIRQYVIGKNSPDLNRFFILKNSYYLRWSAEKIINWKAPKTTIDIIHIHGDNDMVFPNKRIETIDYSIHNGSHWAVLVNAIAVNKVLAQVL